MLPLSSALLLPFQLEHLTKNDTKRNDSLLRSAFETLAIVDAAKIMARRRGRKLGCVESAIVRLEDVEPLSQHQCSERSRVKVERLPNMSSRQKHSFLVCMAGIVELKC
jgi:hypothetical protein